MLRLYQRFLLPAFATFSVSLFFIIPNGVRDPYKVLRNIWVILRVLRCARRDVACYVCISDFGGSGFLRHLQCE